MNRLRKAVEQNNGQTLLGAALYFYDPVFLEVAAHLGYQAIWIEMEHAPITFAEAADLCRMASGSGMLTMIRIPDSRRENILKAAECGPDIINDRPSIADGRDAPIRPVCARRRPWLFQRLSRRRLRNP
jgi:4-hydroxy-2-oxoheptanedioate aldolase